MTNSYLYSIKVNEALERYGAKTHGSLARRVERLKRFTDLKNRKYAEDIRLEKAREDAREAQKLRTEERIRQIYAQERKDEYLERNGVSNKWHAMGSPNYLKDTNTIKMKKDAYLWEAQQEAEIPTTPSHSYNLRPREENGLNLLWRAIQNGFVNTNRG
jgi:hypothetical protein